MKKVIILQKYLMPYRVPLFNEIARQPHVDLTLVYYGRREARRKGSYVPRREFAETKARCISIGVGYERNLELPLSLLKDLERIRPDMIICAPDMGGIAAYLFARRTTVAYAVWSEATPATEGNISVLKERLREALYRGASCFLVPGILAEAYIRQYHQDALVHYAPNSIEEECFAITREGLSAKFGSGRLVITFSGSLIERKGILVLLESFSRLMREMPELQERCLLRVLGAGPLDLSNYQGKNIEFSGFCEQRTYFDYLRASHIFVLPSVHDNNPLTVVEALYSGNVMVLAEGVGNHPEAVRGNGVVVPANSVDALTIELKRILSLPRPDLERMAAVSLEIARNFSIERSAAGFCKAILQERRDLLIAGRPGESHA